VGTSGFSYSHWRGNFYPDSLAQKEFLAYYTKIFNTVEINSTFYHFPRESTLKKWRDSAQKPFLYTVKAHRSITHYAKLSNAASNVENFCRLTRILGDRLGCVLYQLPPSLHKDLNLLESFLKVLPREVRHVIEFRHSSWFQDKDVAALLRKYGVCFCIISAPGLPSVIEISASFTYFRFHGKEHWYSDNYTEDDLKWWAAQALKLLKDKLAVFAYFNNDFGGYAPANAKRLQELVLD
jgi:uncharacterized protein YecE (DUF72 family)